MDTTHDRCDRGRASATSRPTTSIHSTLIHRLAAHAVGRLHSRRTEERGDVPGWVMVTVMSAMLVVALTRLAEPALASLFTDAVERVQGQG